MGATPAVKLRRGVGAEDVGSRGELGEEAAAAAAPTPGPPGTDAVVDLAAAATATAGFPSGRLAPAFARLAAAASAAIANGDAGSGLASFGFLRGLSRAPVPAA